MDKNVESGRKRRRGRALTKTNKHFAEFETAGVPESSTSFASSLWLVFCSLNTSLAPISAMETKKRPHADDAEQSRAKKRAVSDDRASPSHLNGTTTSHGDEPKEGDNIEVM